MNIASAKEINIIKGLPPVLDKSHKCAIDSEWFHMEKRRLHRPHGVHACTTFCFNDKDVYVITDVDDLAQAFENVKDAVHIYANAKFDIKQFRRYIDYPNRKRLWDVQLIEQIQYSGYYTDFSLADLVRRYLDTYLPKEERDAFQDADEMTQEMLEYSCLDTLYTRRVYLCQKEKISDDDLSIWKDIELPFLWTLLSVWGMKIDVDAWMTLYQENYGKALSIQKKYMDNPEILDTMSLKDAVGKKKLQGISLGSNAQVAKEIVRQGYKLPKTKTGRDSTQEDNISPLADECEFVRDVLEFRGLMKAAGTYGKNWIDDGLIEEDGRVYSAFNQLGAATGRLSSSNPNVENIPSKDEDQRFRQCFVAGEGNILVDADWSAQEPRIFAYQSQDEKMINIFKEHKDIYIESGRLMFGWELTKKDPRRKTRMKPTVLGASYGLTEYGMEKKYGIPRDEGKELLDTFFNVFDGAWEYKKKQTRITTYVTTIYGRKFWLNVYERGYENNSLNSPTQGSAADAMKIAGAEFMQRVWDVGYEKEVGIVNYVHDEILLECSKDKLQWTEDNLREVMIQVAEDMHDGIPADAEISHGYTWKDAHN